MYQAEIEQKIRKIARANAILTWTYFLWIGFGVAVELLTNAGVLHSPQLWALAHPGWWFYVAILLILLVLYCVKWSYKQERERLERIAVQDARVRSE